MVIPNAFQLLTFVKLANESFVTARLAQGQGLILTNLLNINKK
jgi:hypothetical protein